MQCGVTWVYLFPVPCNESEEERNTAKHAGQASSNRKEVRNGGKYRKD